MTTQKQQPSFAAVQSAFFWCSSVRELQRLTAQVCNHSLWYDVKPLIRRCFVIRSIKANRSTLKNLMARPMWWDDARHRRKHLDPYARKIRLNRRIHVSSALAEESWTILLKSVLLFWSMWFQNLYEKLFIADDALIIMSCRSHDVVYSTVVRASDFKSGGQAFDPS